MSAVQARAQVGVAIGGPVVSAAAAYVERVLGREALDRIAAGQGVAADVLLDGGEWWGREATVAFLQAAAAASGDADFGRRVGEEMFRAHRAQGVAAFIRQAGSMAAALPGLVMGGTKLCTDRVLTLARAGERDAVIEARFGDPADAHPFFCGVIAGYYSSVPALFGADGAVVETTCQARGDEACRFHVVWQPTRAAGTTAALEGLAGDPEVLLERFEELQSVASRLTEAEDVASVLPLIMQEAPVAVVAPRYLVAVRGHDEHDLLIESVGLDADEAAALGAALIAGAPVPDNVLSVPLETPRTRFGVLAAVYPATATTSAVERRLLAAYAGHAAAALESAASLEAARRDRDTANALLDLARALAAVTSEEDVVRKLAGVVPAVIGCDCVWVWLWDSQGDCLRLVAAPPGVAALDAADQTLNEENVPGLGELATQPRPLIVSLDDDSGTIRRHLDAAGVQWSAVVPISARGDFLGMVSAGFASSPPAGVDPALIERLRGLADHAASALDNARLLDHVRHQALHDPLTGLPNRPLVEDRATHALRAADREGRHVALLFLDLDRFKIVNDTLGHAAGDRLICMVAERLTACLRTSDTLARLGGDEFVVLLPDAKGVADATAAARRIIDGLREPFVLDGRSLFVSCSVGIAVAPHHGRTYSELLWHADAAMYAAKEQGRNGYEIRVTRAGRAHDALELETQLHLAVERDELVVLYQPQIDLHAMRVVGVEALLRWDHPELGRLGPDAFLPIAEESGVIVALDRWVRQTAIAQAAAWRDAGTPVRVAVNISTRDLRRPSLPIEIEELLAAHSLPAELVELEITDRVVMADDALPEVLAALRALGVRLAIDDFGTGTSVLGRLHRCPVDTLKIDKAFVQAITPENPEPPVVNALLSLGRTLGLEIVAEGVETAFQGGALRRQGCELAQGFFFSPPVDATGLDALLAERPGATASA